MRLCWAIFRNFFAFWGLFGRILRHLGFLGRFFLDFYRFFVDFGWISGRFGDGFSMVFRIFAKNRDFVKIVVFLKKLLFSRIRACKNQSKIHQKSMQISYGKIRSKKMLKKWILDGLGLHLGRVWDALGRLLVALGRFLAISGAFKIELL